MNARGITTLLVGMALLGSLALTSPSQGVGATTPNRVPVWHAPTSLPGVPAGSSSVYQATCTAPGNCVVVSYWPAWYYPTHVYVSTEMGGRWGRPVIIGAGLKYFMVNAISCATIRNCAVTGSYQTSTQILGFVLSESNGVWSSPVVVTTPPDFVGLTSSPGLTIACPRIGDCVAGGGTSEAWVMSETNGVWSSPVVLANTSLNYQPSATEEVSCVEAGECTFSGIDTGGSGVFTETLSAGHWGSVNQIANVVSPVAIAHSEPASVNSISCPSVGSCMLGGDYPIDLPPSGTYIQEPYTAVEINGVWQAAHEVPGTGTPSTANVGTTSYVRCWDSMRCVAGGIFTVHTLLRTWVSTYQAGRWSGIVDPSQMRGSITYSDPNEIFCTSPALCVLSSTDTGSGSNVAYDIINGHVPVIAGPVFEDNSWDSHWQRAQILYPLTRQGLAPWAFVNAMACSPTGIYCILGGGRATNFTGNEQSQTAFVATFF